MLTDVKKKKKSLDIENTFWSAEEAKQEVVEPRRVVKLGYQKEPKFKNIVRGHFQPIH